MPHNYSNDHKFYKPNPLMAAHPIPKKPNPSVDTEHSGFVIGSEPSHGPMTPYGIENREYGMAIGKAPMTPTTPVPSTIDNTPGAQVIRLSRRSRG